jgi:hypothetical protein
VSVPPGRVAWYRAGREILNSSLGTAPFRGIPPSSLPHATTPRDTTYTDKKREKISLIYKEMQSGAVAKSCMRKCANISPYIRLRRPLVIYDFATAPLRISLYMRKI